MGNHGGSHFGIIMNRVISICYDLKRIILIMTELRVRTLYSYAKVWDEASCRHIIRHRGVDRSVQLAAPWWPVAPQAFTHIGNRLLGIDELKSQCILPRSGGGLAFIDI